MKILHTSDWHLGRSLYQKRRYEEHSSFLDWLTDVIITEKVDALLVAGDVFDNSTPGNQAQELYYRFLSRIAHSHCSSVIIISGNHDSPTFLNAPKEILKALNVTVVGAITDNIEDEIVVLTDRQDKPSALVCAVPYLRDRDVRTAEAGESLDDKNLKLIQGIKTHYEQVCITAEEKRIGLSAKDNQFPIIAMGHLFTVGAKTTADDGVRELYVGSLAHVSPSVFPASIDYLALGHLHIPQQVDSYGKMRYSGSPLPIGFGEAKQEKKVVLIDFEDNDMIINEIGIPCFQRLEKITGDLISINTRLDELVAENESVWLEIEYTGAEIIPHLRELIEESAENSKLEVLRIKNKPVMEKFIKRMDKNETLDDLDEYEVFNRCLDANNVTRDERTALNLCYQEILHTMNDSSLSEE